MPGSLKDGFDAVGVFDKIDALFQSEYTSGRRDLACCQTVICESGDGEDFVYGWIA